MKNDIDKNMTLVRIYLRESDKGFHKGLLDEMMTILHDEHRVHGVTVFRGIAGFGSHGDVHSADLLRLNVHLPLVLEFFDDPDTVAAAIAALGDRIPSGHLIQWTVKCRVSPER